MIYSLIFALLSFVPQENNLLIGEWKLQSYGAIDEIKSMPAYIFGDDDLREKIDKQFSAILDSGRYIFKKDTLYYTSLKGSKIDYRVALWKLKGKIINREDLTDRHYNNQFYLHKVSNDSLILSFVVEGNIGNPSMVFTRNK